MNAKSSTGSRRDDILSAIGVLILVISTATGNPFVMLAASAVTLAAIAVVYRDKFGRMAWLAGGMALVLAAAVAIAISGF
jgi:hypothetical protein